MVATERNAKDILEAIANSFERKPSKADIEEFTKHVNNTETIELARNMVRLSGNYMVDPARSVMPDVAAQLPEGDLLIDSIHQKPQEWLRSMQDYIGDFAKHYKKGERIVNRVAIAFGVVFAIGIVCQIMYNQAEKKLETSHSAEDIDKAALFYMLREIFLKVGGVLAAIGVISKGLLEFQKANDCSCECNDDNPTRYKTQEYLKTMSKLQEKINNMPNRAAESNVHQLRLIGERNNSTTTAMEMV